MMYGKRDKNSSLLERLVKSIQDRSLRLAVLGSGYVGLPTAALFADAGFRIEAVDVRREVVDAVNSGVSPVREPGLQELVKRNVLAGRLKSSLSSQADLRKADAVIISVQTPIYKSKKPNLSFLKKALKEVGRGCHEGTLVVVSSTIPPGTMANLVKPTLEALTGLRVESDFYLAYVPERIAPGRALQEFVESPRLVGGIGPNSTRVASELFKAVCKNVIETDATVAEVAKLAENTFRDVNIAFANQLALICEHYGVDVKKVIKLANTHPRVAIHNPGPGVGGPCLPKDPYLLISGVKSSRRDLVRTARRINDSMPGHVVEMVLLALKDAGKEVGNVKVTVLGTAYKADVADSRLSPADPIIRRLLRLGIKVTAYDPYCQESFGAEMARDLHCAVRDSDCIIVVTDHAEFKKVDLKLLRSEFKEKPIIIDARRVFDPNIVKTFGFKYYGLGYGFTN
jgi:UDP-N-acetyl-D-mannosaminuronic acid dehydrogenase